MEDQDPLGDPTPDPGADTSPPPAETDAGTPPPPPPPPPPLDPIPGSDCGTAIEQEELVLTNAARADNGLAPLECDVGLTLAARKHSEDMCALGYFSHTSYDGRQFDQRIRAEGVNFGAAGENIAMGQETAEWVHESWMRSSGHRRNILDGSYRRIGIGHAPCASGALWTQDFTD